MNRTLKLKNDERLCDWCDRIADYYSEHDIDTKTFREIIGEVSKWSYIHGSKVTQQTIMKFHHLIPKSK